MVAHPGEGGNHVGHTSLDIRHAALMQPAQSTKPVIDATRCAEKLTASVIGADRVEVLGQIRVYHISVAAHGAGRTVHGRLRTYELCPRHDDRDACGQDSPSI